MTDSLVRVGAVTVAVLGVTAPDVLRLVAVVCLVAVYLAVMLYVIRENPR